MAMYILTKCLSLLYHNLTKSANKKSPKTKLNIKKRVELSTR